MAFVGVGYDFIHRAYNELGSHETDKPKDLGKTRNRFSPISEDISFEFLGLSVTYLRHTDRFHIEDKASGQFKLGSCTMPVAMDEQFRMISLRSLDRRRVRPPMALKFGPASTSSHSKHGFKAHAGGGPLFDATRLLKHTSKHCCPS